MSDVDVIIVGGGHAGCEAASAASRRGASVALIAIDPGAIGSMSCNPAIGGVGKGHLVREVDALDGLIGRAADAAAIHYRMLNRSKGKAVQGPRIQADRLRFKAWIQAALASDPSIAIVKGTVDDLLVEGDRCTGVLLADGQKISARAVVLATGTFLGGRLVSGNESWEGGRVGEAPAIALAQRLRAMSLPLGRLKTGTPPRLDGRTIDWSRLEQQYSDHENWTMSPLGQRVLPQAFCGIARTNEKTHDLIRDAIPRSPRATGMLQGQGPRYCPSIEDKVVRFADRTSHQIFLEPEGCDITTVYPNGISTSLSADDQTAVVRTIDGLQNAKITEMGYAVEYDFVDPRSLTRSLESREYSRLFLAGQINGTTGYEEAAAQGLLAGANAASAALGQSHFAADRATSYIGVMIDDLTVQGVSEPYRMLTARSEYRLSLRADNAQTRLTPVGRAAGIVGEERWAKFLHRVAELEAIRERVTPAIATTIHRGAHASLYANRFWEKELVEEVIEDIRYAPYVERQNGEVAERRARREITIRADLDYRNLPGISAEMCERLERVRPKTMAEAEKINGVTPSALTIVLRATHRGRRSVGG